MRNDGVASGDGTSNAQSPLARPWRLSVPNYTSRKRQRTNAAHRRVDIDNTNDTVLLLESKGDPRWHSMRIPLERRKVLRLPILSWNQEERSQDEKPSFEIEALVETGAHMHRRQTARSRTVSRVIPLELKKRKRCDTFSPSDADSTGPIPMKNGDSEQVKKVDSMPTLISLLTEQVPTFVIAQETASEVRETKRAESSTTESSSQVVQQNSFARPESPPMRILSVRSLADNSSYLYDPLEERIPVDVPDKSGDDQPPLYIFNPVRRYSDAVAGKAQNDFQSVVNSKTPKETPSDTRIPIKASDNPAKYTAAASSAMQSSHGSNLDNFVDDTRTAIVRNPLGDGSLDRNEPGKVSPEIKPEIETGTSVPITRDTPPSVGETTSARAGVSKSPKPSSKSIPDTLVENIDQSRGCVPPSQTEERLIYTCTSDDLRFVIGFDPNSSPFEDSDVDDEDMGRVRSTCDPIEPNFTSCILKELDVNGGETKDDAQRLAELDHSYSKPQSENVPSTPVHVTPMVTEEHSPTQSAATAENCLSIKGPTRLLVRLPKPLVKQATEFANAELLSKRHRKNSSSSSTDTSVGVSSKPNHFDTSVFREQRQDELITKRKVMKSEIILRKMQHITQKERSQFPADTVAHEKVTFIRKLANYFRKNDFSKEPLNRSILNAIAEWLTPLSNGRLPPLNLRDTLIDLIKEFTLTTPAQVFQTSSIEGVLILLMNHPRESFRNKRIEWFIVNSWRDD